MAEWRSGGPNRQKEVERNRGERGERGERGVPEKAERVRTKSGEMALNKQTRNRDVMSRYSAIPLSVGMTRMRQKEKEKRGQTVLHCRKGKALRPRSSLEGAVNRDISTCAVLHSE